MNTVSHNAGRRLPAETYTSAEVQALLAQCNPGCPTGARNRALIAVLWRGGLRLAEALALRPADIDLASGAVRILRGKGGKARMVALDYGALALVQAWLHTRASLGHHGHAPLFCTLEGQPLKAPYIRALLPRLARAAGVDKRVHAHGLRHSCAADLAAEGVPVNVIQQALGHSSVATTSRYLDHIAPQQVIRSMHDREW